MFFTKIVFILSFAEIIQKIAMKIEISIISRLQMAVQSYGICTVRLPKHHAVIGRVVVQSRHRLYPARLFQVLSAPLLVRHAVSEHVEERVGLGGDLPVAFLHSVISGSECL